MLRMKPYIQPFERAVALEELARVSGSEPIHVADDTRGSIYSVKSGRDPEVAAERLAYWERVYLGDTSVVTAQSKLESSAAAARNGLDTRALASLELDEHAPLPQRRMLRYGPHGIHEYRGKFFPQLVRAFVNAAGVEPGGLVADPMVGSGTTPVEVTALGIDALALDMNPLSVLVTSTKCRVLAADGQDIVDAYEAARSWLSRQPRDPGLPYLHSLDVRDQEYLRSWIPESALGSLDLVASYARRLPESPFRDLMRVSLSNIIRRVSWQKNDDLRVRRDVASAATEPVIAIYLDELLRAVRSVVAYLSQRRTPVVGNVRVAEGDARDIGRLWASHASAVDLVVTSPPYATALPYLDTDRLSLSYLDLLPRADHRRRDALMIGNREVTEAQRTRLLETYDAACDGLPADVRGLVDRVRRLNDGATVGFRRRNTAALLGKYFLDMKDVLVGIQTILRPNGQAVIVVGSNHTLAGGERVEIATATLIGALAGVAGLSFERLLPMEMLVSRDIFRRNASSAESIVILRR